MHLSKPLAAKFAAVLMAFTVGVIPASAASIGTVTSDAGLNVRSEANTEASVLATLDYGTQVDVLETSADGSWHQISYNGVTGYVVGDYLKVTEEKLYGQVVSGPLNIRSGPARTMTRWAASPPAKWWRLRSSSAVWAAGIKLQRAM